MKENLNQQAVLPAIEVGQVMGGAVHTLSVQILYKQFEFRVHIAPTAVLLSASISLL